MVLALVFQSPKQADLKSTPVFDAQQKMCLKVAPVVLLV
jgi:hypothetical protein